MAWDRKTFERRPETKRSALYKNCMLPKSQARKQNAFLSPRGNWWRYSITVKSAWRLHRSWLLWTTTAQPPGTTKSPGLTNESARSVREPVERIAPNWKLIFKIPVAGVTISSLALMKLGPSLIQYLWKALEKVEIHYLVGWRLPIKKALVTWKVISSIGAKKSLQSSNNNIFRTTVCPNNAGGP